MKLSDRALQLAAGYISNPALKTILKSEEWKGTPVTKNGNFINIEFPFIPSFSDAFKVWMKPNPKKEEKKNDTWKLEVIKDLSFLSGSEDVIVWLGHASFFIRINGLKILIDPVFYDLGFIKRLSEMPVDPDLFRNLNYIFVSHNHRDHCDEKSIKLLHKNNPGATYLTGLKLDVLLKKWTGSNKIQAAGWYQQYNTSPDMEVTYLPTRHWARRGLTDDNTSLWGAYMIQAKGKTIYFSGDSGKGDHFREAGELFPGIDICMVGVGAYYPEWFMEPSHMNPSDAFEAAKQLKSKMMIPMHYGTFDLSFEPRGEPLRILKKISEDSKESVRINPLPVGMAFPF